MTWFDKGFLTAICLVTLLVCLLPGTLLAANIEANNLLERGRFEMEDGNYLEAVKLFDEALKLAPGEINIQIARGQALLKLGRVQEAEAQFAKVEASGPEAAANANVELGALYVQTKEYPKAIERFDRAIAAQPQRSDIYLARGAAYMETQDYSRAEADFQKAGQVNPQAAAAAKFYLAVLSYRQEDLPTTDTRLEQALSQSPDQGLTKQIHSMQQAVKQEQKARKSWAVITSLVAQYDDNVNLDTINGPEGARKTQGDSSLGFNLHAMYYFFNRRSGDAGVSYSYRSQFYQHMSENDLQGHTVGAFFTLNAYPWYFRVQADTSFYYVHGNDTMTVYSVSPVLARMLGDNGRAELLATMERKLRQDGGVDSYHGVVGATYYHTLMTPPSAGSSALTARVGGQYEVEEPDNNRGSRYWLKEIKGGLSFPLPAQLEGDIGLAYAFIEYGKNELFYGNRTRYDQRLTVSAKIGRSMTESTRFDLLYTHTTNSSSTQYGNFTPYNFGRNVYSLIFTGLF